MYIAVYVSYILDVQFISNDIVIVSLHMCTVWTLHAWNNGFHYVRTLLCHSCGLSLLYSPSTFELQCIQLLRSAYHLSQAVTLVVFTA